MEEVERVGWDSVTEVHGNIWFTLRKSVSFSGRTDSLLQKHRKHTDSFTV